MTKDEFRELKVGDKINYDGVAGTVEHGESEEDEYIIDVRHSGYACSYFEFDAHQMEKAA